MSNSVDDFFAPAPRMPLGYGGARPNSGPKPKTPKAPRGGDTAPPEEGGEPTAYQRYEQARADKEESMARQAAVKADLDEGQVVDREAVRSGCAQAFAACSQSLDAIGDSLEREGISIEVSERVMTLVNAAKEQLALDLERLHAENA